MRPIFLVFALAGLGPDDLMRQAFTPGSAPELDWDELDGVVAERAPCPSVIHGPARDEIDPAKAHTLQAPRKLRVASQRDRRARAPPCASWR